MHTRRLTSTSTAILVSRVRDWPHSSFHRDVEEDLFRADWAGDISAIGSFGEAV
jgi:putative transposase